MCVKKLKKSKKKNINFGKKVFTKTACTLQLKIKKTIRDHCRNHEIVNICGYFEGNMLCHGAGAFAFSSIKNRFLNVMKALEKNIIKKKFLKNLNLWENLFAGTIKPIILYFTPTALPPPLTSIVGSHQVFVKFKILSFRFWVQYIFKCHNVWFAGIQYSSVK